MQNEPSREYAEKRTREHFEHFDEVWNVTLQGSDPEFLEKIEQPNPVFSDLPWNMYEPYV